MNWRLACNRIYQWFARDSNLHLPGQNLEVVAATPRSDDKRRIFQNPEIVGVTPIHPPHLNTLVVTQIEHQLKTKRFALQS